MQIRKNIWLSIMIAALCLNFLVHHVIARENLTGMGMTDAEFFSNLNLHEPMLKDVKVAVEQNNLVLAKHNFVEYLKNRQEPKWFFDWNTRDTVENSLANFETTEADRFARNELVSVGIWHSFGSDINWQFNPTDNGYPEWPAQLNRHGFWISLGKAYWKTGDEKYAQAFVNQMKDWVRDNPVPHTRANYNPSWSTLGAGIRMSQSWPNAFYYFLHSPSFTENDIITMIKSFSEHANYLTNFPSQGGNWLLYESSGLYHVGVLFPEFKQAQRWRREAMKRLYNELDNQVYDDGVQIELSTSYHQASLGVFSDVIHLAQLNNYLVRQKYLTTLEKMYNYNLYASMPNGYLPPLNDDSGCVDVRESLKEGFNFFPNRTDFQWASTNGREGTQPIQKSYVFPYAGQLIMRSNWNPNAKYLLFDVGPFGYGHQHEDKLNFVIHAYGTNLLIDPGTYAYDNSKWRRYFISSYAHNVIHVDGKEQYRRDLPRDQYVVDKPLPYVWQSSNDFDYAQASFGDLPDEAYGQSRDEIATHTRHILFVKNSSNSQAETQQSEYWLVVDMLEPKVNNFQEHTYEAMFHFNVEDVIVDPVKKSVLSKNENGSQLAIVPLADSNLSLEIIKGQESPFVQGFARKGCSLYNLRPIATPIFKRIQSGVSYFVYVLFPVSPEGEMDVTHLEGVEITPERIKVNVIFKDGRVDQLQIRPKVEITRSKDER